MQVKIRSWERALHYQKPEQTFWPTQHLVVSPTKYVQELYEENYKTQKEIKEEFKKK